MARRSNGEGTAPYQQPDGRWRAELVVDWVYRDGKLRPVRKRVYGATAGAARAKLRALIAERDAGAVFTTGTTPTLGAWLTHWLDTIAAPRVRASTLATYRGLVARYVTPDRVNRVKVDRVTPAHLEQLYAGMRNRDLSSSTVHGLHRVLSRAFRVAEQRGVIRTSPTSRMDAPSLVERTMTALTMDQARVLRAAASESPDEARHLLRVSLGLRTGELLGLGWEDVDLEAGSLTVRRSLGRVNGRGMVFGAPKTARGARRIPLPGPVVDVLREHRDAQDRRDEEYGEYEPYTDTAGATVDLVFHQPNGRPIPEHRDWEEWRALLTTAGLPLIRRHDARHTAATMLLAMGVPARVVMDIMGWAQIGMSTRYQHPEDEMLRTAMDAVAGELFREDPALPPNVVPLRRRG